MPLEEFRIEFDNPAKSYFPGQNVSGRLIITNSKEKGTQGVKLKFEGTATVEWTEDVSETHGTGDQRQTRKVKRLFNDSENFFDYKMYAVGDGRSDMKLPPGRNVYPFSFSLPPMGLPSSYVGEYGQVNYQIEATIKRSWKFDQTVKEKFTVNSIVDLNVMTEALEPVDRKCSKHFCCLCCASGEVGFKIKMQKAGFVPGEYIDVEVELFNQSGRGINSISFALLQEATFYAKGKQKQAIKQLASVKGPGGVDPGDTNIWKPKLQVPAVPPSKLGGCRIIDVKYFLRFELHVSGLAFNLKEAVQILIGTIPLQTTFSELRNAINTGQNRQSGQNTTNFEFSPSAPMYPEMPHPNFHESFDFGPGPVQPKSIGGLVAETVVDNVMPTEKQFFPNYPAYGWINIKNP